MPEGRHLRRHGRLSSSFSCRQATCDCSQYVQLCFLNFLWCLFFTVSHISPEMRKNKIGSKLWGFLPSE